MKLGLAIRQVRSAEQKLADELHKVGERHKTDHEIYHVSRTLADISRRNAREIARFQERYPVSGGTETGRSAPDLFGKLRQKGSEMVEAVSDGRDLLDAVREKSAEMIGRRPESGLLLVRDLRRLYLLASEASINWVILGQGAQAAKDRELLQATRECHPDTLRTLKWANTMLKIISPQVLTS